jgi:hypothetical protein
VKLRCSATATNTRRLPKGSLRSVVVLFAVARDRERDSVRLIVAIDYPLRATSVVCS